MDAQPGSVTKGFTGRSTAGKAELYLERSAKEEMMTVYKCPACGRSNLELPVAEAAEPDAGLMTLPNVQTEAKCKDCGWFGSITDVKSGH